MYTRRKTAAPISRVLPSVANPITNPIAREGSLMISISRATAVVVALFALSPLVVEAHHAASMFEAEKETTVTGVVKEFQYTNPHSWLLLDVTNNDGSVTTSAFEPQGPGVLMRNGIRKSDFAAGT